jgi:hypothetical protein
VTASGFFPVVEGRDFRALGAVNLSAPQRSDSCAKNQLDSAANSAWPRGRGGIDPPGRALAKAGIPAFTSRTTIPRKRSAN